MKKLIIKNKKRIIAGTAILTLFVLAFLYFGHPKITVSPDLLSNNSKSIDQGLGDFVIKIPKIAVEAPVLLDVDPNDKNQYNQKLKNGVALMTGSALPGSGKGKIFIYGHSSAAETSKYQKIFSELNDLVAGDDILVRYNGVDYNYIVKTKKVVEENDLSVLDQTENETLSLMTCWPIGTDKERLIVSGSLK
jgi:sortase A